MQLYLENGASSDTTQIPVKKILKYPPSFKDSTFLSTIKQAWHRRGKVNGISIQMCWDHEFVNTE